MSKAEIMKTSIFYLSAEPCSVRDILSKLSFNNNSIITEVMNSEETCIILRRNVSSELSIMQSSLTSVFQEIDKSTMKTLKYVIISTFFSNHAIYANDVRNHRILKL